MLVSVVVPTIDEAHALPLLLGDLEREVTPHEVVVVDGGSRDDTVDIALARGCLVRFARGGRGAQLRAGAEAARGAVLLFLHADCRFPAGGLARVAASVSGTAAPAGGNFRLLFDGDDEFSRWLDGFYARIRARGVYYGDSGIFVRRDCYQRMGGIRPLALMEDYDFVRRLERLGPTVCIEQPPLLTSSRRFAGRGRRRIIAGWLLVHLLFHLGVPTPLLARLYRSTRH